MLAKRNPTPSGILIKLRQNQLQAVVWLDMAISSAYQEIPLVENIKRNLIRHFIMSFAPSHSSQSQGNWTIKKKCLIKKRL